MDLRQDVRVEWSDGILARRVDEHSEMHPADSCRRVARSFGCGLMGITNDVKPVLPGRAFFGLRAKALAQYVEAPKGLA